MKGFLKYFIIVWVTGLGTMLLFVFGSGHQDWDAERAKTIDQSSRLASSVQLSLDHLTEKTANELTRIVEVELVSTDMTHWLSDSSFQSIALVGESGAGSWQLEWVKSKKTGDTRAQFNKWLPNLPVGRIQGNTLSWNRVVQDGKKPMLLLGVPLKVKGQGGESLKVALGVLPLNYLASLTDPLKADEQEVFIVDGAGYALTFPDQAYVGSLMDVHPIVARLKSSQKLSEYGDFSNLQSDATVGGFQKAKNSNVYVVTNQKILTRKSAIWHVFLQSGLAGVGLIAILSFITLFVTRRDFEHFEQLKKLIRNVGPGSQPQQSAVYEKAVDAAKERKAIFEQLGLTFLSHLRGPVYSSLGKLHKLSEEVSGTPAEKEVSFLEVEVRRLRDFIEGIGQAFNLDSRPSEVVNFSDQIDKYTRLSVDTWRRLRVEWNLETHPNAHCQVSPDDLEFILKTLLKYSGDRLNQVQGDRILSMQVQRAGGMVRLSLALSGVSLSPAEAEKLFMIKDPEHLDLSFARGFAVAWNGNLTAEAAGQNLILHLELPAQEVEEPAEEASLEVEEASEAVAEEKTTQMESPLVEASLTQMETIPQDTLTEKRIDQQLDEVLPPSPMTSSSIDVSVVDELTATATQTLTEPDDPKADALEVKIRKPKVRTET